MPLNPVALVQDNLTLAILGVLGLVLAAWAYEAVDEAEDHWEAAGGFKNRAASGTGGALNVVLVSIVALVGWGATTFSTAGGAVAFLLTLAPEVPVLAASVFTVSLGAIGLTDLIVLRAWHFVTISAVVLLLAYAYRAGLNEVRLS